VDEGTQPVGQTTLPRQPALGRRTYFSGSQENRYGIHSTHHLRRVAASAARGKLHQVERA